MSITAKEDCIKLLNNHARAPSVETAIAILSIYLEENTNPNKDQAIQMIVSNFMLQHSCVAHAIKELIKKYSITTVLDKQNNFIYFF